MFATTDSRAARHVHVFVLRPGLEREILPGAAQRDRLLRVRALPTDARLAALGRDLLATPVPDAGPARAVRVQVWRTTHDRDTLVPSSHILREVEIDLGHD